MVDTAPGAASASVRRDAILQAVADAAEWLLLAADWRFAADDVIARLGIAAEVSRAYVIENHPGPDGATLGSLSVEWCAPGIPSNEGNEFLSGYDWEHGFGRFADLHRAGEAVMGAVADFPPEERPELERQGIVSLVELPVMVRGAWWGVVGFDDCAVVRDWTGAEIDALRAAATLLGAAIGRQLQDEDVRRSERRYRQLVERLPGITYTDEVPSEGGPAFQGFVSPQALDILGYPPERFTTDAQLWFSVMHPDDRDRLTSAGAFDSADTSLFDEEYRMIAADGRVVWVHDSSIPIFAPDGSLEYFLGFAIDITGRKLAEERQRETEQRYRDLVERLPAVTYLQSVVPGTSVAEATTYMSPLIESILGYPVDRWYSDVSFWRRIVHPDDRELIDSMEAASEETGESFSYDHRLIAADGRVVWVHEEAVLIRATDGTPQYWQGFILDITERKQAEEQLRQAEERFRLIVERTPAVTYQEAQAASGSYDLSALTSYVSPQIEAIVGFPPERWNEPGFWLERIYPEDRARVQAESSATNDSGEPYRQDYRMIAADGRIVWFHDESQLIRDDDGRPLYWQGVMVDITDRKEAEEQLRQAEERFRMIVERTPAIVYQELPSRSERAGSVVYVSGQIERILGYPQDVWATHGAWIDMVHPDDRDRMLAVDAASDDGTPYGDEYRMIAADGRVVWFHDEAVLINDEHGLPLMWQGVMVDITEQKEAEELVRSTEKRYRALIEHIPAIVYAEAIVSDADELYLSPQIERVLGYTAERWKGTPNFWATHVHPDDRERVLGANRRANETGDPFLAEYRFLADEGDYRWLHDEAVRVIGDDGEPLFWQGVLVDITEQKRAEIGLRDAEERYRALVEHIPAVVYTEMLDADPERFYISPQVEQVFGWTADEWRWTPDFWFAHVHPDDLEHVREIDERSNETREAYSMDYRFQHGDGHWMWVRDEAMFLPDPDGEREGYWQGFLLDITERKESEVALSEAELKFRTIVEQNQAIFYTQEIDPEDPTISNTTYIAPGNTDMIGYTLAEIQADPALWRKIVHPDDRERVFAADAESNRGEGDDHFSLEYRMLSKDGRIVWVQDEARFVRLPGRAPYWQGFLLDITERKQTEAQLERALAVEREAAQRLRALDEMKNTFLQAVSHDLRTPLAAILGLAITLERGDVQLEQNDAKDLARRIAGNARRLDRLVTNLLDLDRLSRGIVAPKLEPTDIGDLARRAIEDSELLSSARVRIDIQPTVLPADASKVERIIENLLANTARHTPATATIWVRVHPVDDGGIIAIEDNGAGVAESLREAIFEPFRQGPDAPRHSPGVGVGLTLVRRFAELHGGRAWVEARDGGGASFRVFLPALAPEDLETSFG